MQNKSVLVTIAVAVVNLVLMYFVTKKACKSALKR